MRHTLTRSSDLLYVCHYSTLISLRIFICYSYLRNISLLSISSNQLHFQSNCTVINKCLWCLISFNDDVPSTMMIYTIDKPNSKYMCNEVKRMKQSVEPIILETCVYKWGACWFIVNFPFSYILKPYSVLPTTKSAMKYTLT